jgi:hypothetical protein
MGRTEFSWLRIGSSGGFLLLVVLPLSVVTTHKIKLLTLCTVYDIYNMYKTYCQSRFCKANYASSFVP